MSVAAIGAVDYTKALDGLSLKQAQLMLTTQGIVGEEQKDLLVKQGLIATSDRMSASIVSEALANTALNKEQQEAILIKAGLMKQETKELITGNACTEAKLRAILAEKGIKGAKADTLIASILQTGQNAKEAISWDVLATKIEMATTKMLKWLFTTPAGWATLAIGAVVGLTVAYAKLASTAESAAEAQEKLKESESNLSSARDELATIDDKISEIKSKSGELGISNQAELQRLETERAILEDQVRLLELRKELHAEESNREAVQAVRVGGNKQEKWYKDADEIKIYQITGYSSPNRDGIYKNGLGSALSSGYAFVNQNATTIDEYYKQIEEITKEIADWESKPDSEKRTKKLEKLRSNKLKLEEGLDNSKEDLMDIYLRDSELLLQITGDDEASNSARKKLQNEMAFLEQFIYTKEQLAKIRFDDFIKDENNKGVSDGFKDIQKDGEVTAQEITGLASKFSTLKKFMDDNGISAETLATELNNVGTEAENSGENANKMTVSLSDLEKVSDNIGKLSSAFKELSGDGYITTKTLGEIKTATGLSDDAWAKYEQKLLTAKAGSAEFNQVMSELTYKMLDAKFRTIDLTNATEEEISAIETKIAATLRENGVTNASAVAHDYVARAKEEARIKTKLLAGATYEEVVALSAEAAQAGITGKEFIDLVIDIGILNNTSLDPQQKIQALQEIGFYADWTAKKISEVGKVSRFSSNGKDGLSVYDKDGKLIDVKIFDDYTPPKYEPPEIPDFSSALKDSKKDSKDKTPFDDSYYSEVDSWLKENEKEIEHLEKEFESLNRQFENALETGNKDSIEILRKKLAENAKAQKDLLHSQNDAHRITQGELLQSLYDIVPSLKEKSWDEISDVDLQRIENELNKKVELASDDNEKNQAKLKLNQYKGIIGDKQTLDDEIQKNSEAWWDADEKIADSWRSTIDARNEASEDWISAQKDLNNLTVEEELAAYKRMLDYNEDYLSQILADERLSKEAREALWAYYYKKQKDDEVKYHQLAVDSIKNSLQQAYDDFEERMEKRRKALDFEKEQLSSLSTLLGKHHEVLNSIDEEQHNITKELEASKTMTQYLDEETRKLLFNQADYNALSEELVYLKEKANSLQEKYQRDIANATLENVAEITSNYERQYDIMLKQYEIAKAELEVAKKRQQLDNVLAEKNVKMLINGRWQWVANTQDVINAQNELADAEYNVTKAQSGLDQTTEQHKLQSMINSLETTGNEMDAMLERRKNRLDEILKSFEQKPGELSDILAEISASGVTTISEVCGKVSGALGDLYRSLTGKSVNVSTPVTSSGNSNRFTINGTAYNPKTMDLGEDGSITLYYDDNGKLISHGGLNKYASGTKSALRGLAEIGEEGSEFLAKNGHLIPINQPTLANLSGGEMVFNHSQMDNLWKISAFDPSKLLIRNPQGNIDNSNCNNINIGDLRLDATSGIGKELADVLYRIKNMR